MNKNFADHGYNLTHEQWTILIQLWHEDGLKQQEIANNLDKDKVSVTKLLDGLERRELVVRKHCKTDRRINLIYLTEKAREVQPKLNDLAKLTLSEALNGISDNDKTKLVELMEKMFNNLSKKI